MVINFADLDFQQAMIIFEHFNKDDVDVSLGWENSLQPYYVNIALQPSLLINQTISSTVRLKVLYNILYNVSIVITSPCGPSVTINETYYGECHTCKFIKIKI